MMQRIKTIMIFIDKVDFNFAANTRSRIQMHYNQMFQHA